MTAQQNEKKKILIIGAGTFQFPLVQKAAERHEVYIAAPVVPERFRKLKGVRVCIHTQNCIRL